MPRFARIAGSFIAVTAVYWLYAIVAVPWIEPAVNLRRSDAISDEMRQRTGELPEYQVKQIEALFPPEVCAKLKASVSVSLSGDRAMLFFQRYDNVDGQVVLYPCTIVFPNEGMPVAVEAESAVLRFDAPVDLARAQFGKPVAGQLRGAVTIRSPGKEPGPQDDLQIVTRDIAFNQGAVTTPHEVAFRWGPHSGRGRDLVIQLLMKDNAPKSNAAGPNVAGIESLELQHVDDLCLDLGPALAGAKKTVTPTPVHITCRGAFRFDALQRRATFSKQVEVLKSNPTGPRDQILCDELAVGFIPRAAKKSPGAPPPAAEPGLADLVAERLEASGNPVVASIPSQTVAARGRHLTYNLLSNAIALDNNLPNVAPDALAEVVLVQGANEIHARSLSYAPNPARRIGRVDAPGPGWLRVQAPQGSAPPLEAKWKGQLCVEPTDQFQVTSLAAGAELNFRERGCLNAEQIYLWLREAPGKDPAPQSGLNLDRLTAKTTVRFHAPEVDCRLDELQMWFAQGQAVAGAVGATPKTGPAAAAANPLSPQQWLAQPAATNGAPATSSPTAAAKQGHYEVTGNLLQISLLLQEPQPAVTSLRFLGGVDIVETQQTQPSKTPLHIRGERLEVTNADKPEAEVEIIGRSEQRDAAGRATPAEMACFEGQGLGLYSPAIKLNRGANRLSTDGPGRLNLPLPVRSRNQQTAAPGTLTLTWRRSMEFDGLVAQFHGNVVAQTQQPKLQATLQAADIDVQMQQAVRFTDAKIQPPQVEQVLCYGDVVVNHRAYDEQQQLAANNRLQICENLVVNMCNGAMEGGHGWLNTVRRGSAIDLSDNSMAASIGTRPATANAAAEQLNCLHVRFYRAVKGNLWQHQMTFRDNVCVTYAPVDSWDALLDTDNPDALGPDGVVVHCDELSITETARVGQERGNVGLLAQGNAVIDGATFRALCNTITYDQAKDQVILRGDGRSNVQLFRQLQPGAAREESTMQEIVYSRKYKTWSGVGPRLQLQLPPAPPAASRDMSHR